MVDPLNVLLYRPRMIDKCEAVGGMKISKGNRSTQEKTRHRAILSTTNPT
jgi:hypothetical protein